MKSPFGRTTLFFIIFLFCLYAPARKASAETTIGCHCFKDRSYNPANRFAADDYILATSFNSLLARAFDIPKRQIVMLKMQQNVEQNDLLIALKTAQATKVDLQKILDLRQKKEPWATIISDAAGDKIISNDPVLKAITTGLPDDRTATAVADALFAGFYKIPLAEIKELRENGLNEKELALLFILARTGNREPKKLVAQHEKDGKSWSEIANDLGIEPGTAGKLILNYPARQVSQ